MLQVDHLTKYYGETCAVRDLSFAVPDHGVVGLLGRNGAGKSTTMNIITGYLSPSGGAVTLDGYDLQRDEYEYKRRMGYLPETPPLYPDMTVLEYLRFCCGLKNVKRNRIRSHLGDVIDMTGLQAQQGSLIRSLSKGYKQRVGIAQALVGNPPFLVLDEPTSGLDPGQIVEIRNLIRQLGRDHAVMLSSHILPDVQDVCGRILIIHEGRLVLEEDTEALAIYKDGQRRCLAQIKGDESAVSQALRSQLGDASVESVREHDGVCECVLMLSDSFKEREALFWHLAERKLPLLRLEDEPMNLEKVFLNLTQRDFAAERGNEHDSHLEA